MKPNHPLHIQSRFLDVVLYGASADTEAPSTPAGFVLTGTDDGAATFAWTANSEPDLDHYNLYRSTTQGFTPGPSNLLGTIAAGTETYSDTGLTNGTSYYYRLSAVDASENESGFASEVEAIPQATETIPPPGMGAPEWVHDGIPNGTQRRAKVTAKKTGGGLSAPTNLVGTPGDGQITWQWDAVAGAESYVVYETTEAALEVTPGVDESSVSNEATATPTSLLNGLVAGWGFEETGLTDEPDLVGSMTLDAVDVSDISPGKLGNARHKDLATVYGFTAIDGADPIAIATLGSFTLLGWIKPDNVTFQYVYWHGNGGTVSFYIQLRTAPAGTVRARIYDSGGASHDNDSAGGMWAEDVWQMVGLRYDAVAKTLSVITNATIKSAALDITARDVTPDSDFCLGSDITTKTYVGGFDDTFVWGRALSDSEIADFYNSGNGVELFPT